MASAASTEWEDVTDFIRKTAARMAPGRMIHGEYFSLRESMSAVELMDPKMDTGMHAELIMSLDETLKAGKLPRELTAPQILAVMDQLLACEQSWHQGRQLACSVLLCWYCHRPTEELIASAALRAYIRALLRTISVVREVIINADVYEEEDFASREVHALRVGDETNDAEVDALLRDAISTVEKRAKGEQAGERFDEDPEKDKQFAQAVLARLKYRQSILEAHRQLSLPEMKGLDAALPHLRSAADQLSQVHSTAALACPTPAEDRQDRVAALLRTPGFDKYVARQLLPSMPPREPQVMAREDAFKSAEVLVQQMLSFRLLSLQNSKQQQPAASQQQQQEGKEKGKEQAAAAQHHPLLNTHDELLAYCRALSAQSPAPNIVVRSHLLWLMHSDANFLGRGPLSELVKESMQAFCVNTVDFFWHPEALLLAQRAAQPVALLFRLTCENRARQRRRIAKLLDDWIILQNESYYLDANVITILAKLGFQHVTECPNTPHRHIYLSWAIEQSVWLLLHYFLLGVELELFTPKELSMVYWYLDYLYSRRLLNRDHAYRLPLRLPQDTLKLIINSNNPSAMLLAAKRKKGLPRPPVPQRSPIPPREGDFLLAEAQQFLCRGLCYAMTAFEAEGVLVESWPAGYQVDKIPPALVASQLDLKLSEKAQAVERDREIWFVQRFSAIFKSLGEPRPLTLRDFDRTVAAGKQDPTLLLGKANESFQQARASASKLLQALQQSKQKERAALDMPYVKSLVKTAVANGVCVLGLRKAQQQHPAGLRLAFSFENPHFPIMQLLPAKPKNNAVAGSS